MKIAMYMTRMHKPGGVGSYLRRISAALAEAGHQVVFLSVTDDEPAERPEEITYASNEDQIPALAHRAGADLLHTHTLLRFSAPPPLPIIRTVHNHEPYCPSGSRFLASKGKPCDRSYSLCGCTWGHLVNHCGSVRPGAMRAEFRRTQDELIHTRQMPALAVSEFVRIQMLRAGYSAAKVQTLPLPAPAAEPIQPPLNSGIPRIVFLGRLTPQKGVDWLLRSCKLVKREFVLDIAGEGHPTREKEYRDLADALAGSLRVIFHPWLDTDGVNALLREARALVFPSLWHEPAGLVALEAMAGGRAVIGTRVGGVPEFVTHGQTGLLVEPGDSAALAASIERLIDEPAFADHLGRAGHQAVREQFTLEAHVAGLYDAYRRAIEGFARSELLVQGAH